MPPWTTLRLRGNETPCTPLRIFVTAWTQARSNETNDRCGVQPKTDVGTRSRLSLSEKEVLLLKPGLIAPAAF
jgi:hypothetical protein